MEFLTLFCVLLIGSLKAKGLFSSSDDELALEAKNGNRASFDKLYDKYKRPIINYIYRYIGDLSHAEELAQEAFIRVYTNIDRYVEKGKFSSWVYTIAGNLAKNFLRDKSHFTEISIDKEIQGQEGEVSLLDIIADKGRTPQEETQKEEIDKIIQQGINKLKPKHREVIILCDIQGLSYEEAAKILKCPSATVGSRLSRAREYLARILKVLNKK